MNDKQPTMKERDDVNNAFTDELRRDFDKPTENPSDIQIGGAHYKNFVIQPYEYCHKNKLGMLESNVIKYVSRHGSKNGAEDIKKAIHTLQLLLEIEYNK